MLKYGYRIWEGIVNFGGAKLESLQGSGKVLNLCFSGEYIGGLMFFFFLMHWVVHLEFGLFSVSMVYFIKKKKSLEPNTETHIPQREKQVPLAIHHNTGSSLKLQHIIVHILFLSPSPFLIFVQFLAPLFSWLYA